MLSYPFQPQRAGLVNYLNNEVFANLGQSDWKEVGELLYKQLYSWVAQNREHVSTTWTPFLLQGAHA